MSTAGSASIVMTVGLCAVAPVPAARADAVAYLVNVTMRPGYNFTGADAAPGSHATSAALTPIRGPT